MFRKPEGVRKRCLRIQPKIVRSPTPPSHRSECRKARMMQFPNQGAIIFKLCVIVGADTEKQSLRGNALSGFYGEAEFDLILRERLLERILLRHFRGSGGIDFERMNFFVSIVAINM